MEHSIDRQFSSANTRSAMQDNFFLASQLLALAVIFFIPIKTNIFNIFLILALLTVCLSGRLKFINIAMLKIPMIHAGLVFLIMCIISMTYASTSFHHSLIGFQKYGKILFLLFLVPVFSEKCWRNRAINVYLIIMLLTVFLSYLKYFKILTIGLPTDPGNLFRNHITTSFMMSFTGFILAHRTFDKKINWFYGCLLLLTLIQLFFINTGRAGYITVISLMFLFAWQKHHWKGVLMLCLGIPLLITALYMTSKTFNKTSLTAIHNVQRYYQGDSDSSSGIRLEFIKNSVSIIKEKPLLGTGLGSFKPTYYHRFPKSYAVAYELDHPHNEFIMLTFQLGLIGLFIFLWFIYACWKFSSTLPNEYKYLQQGVIITLLISALFECTYLRSPTGYCFVYFLSLCTGASIIKIAAPANKTETRGTFRFEPRS